MRGRLRTGVRRSSEGPDRWHRADWGVDWVGAEVGEGFSGEVLGWDANAEELGTALRMGAIDRALASPVRLCSSLRCRCGGACDAGAADPGLDGAARSGDGRRSARDRCGLDEARNRGARAEAVQPAGTGKIFAGASDGGQRIRRGGVWRRLELFRGAAWLFTPDRRQRSEIEREWVAAGGGVWGAGDGDGGGAAR